MDLGQKNFVGAHNILSILVSYQIDHFFVSPGSRSTPLVLALQDLVPNASFVVLDERSASFGALGFAKTSDRIPAVICTSGTAVANYLPAVIEASQSRIPFVLITADRPAEMVGIGAPQTIVQKDIFGDYVCDCLDFEPAPHEHYSIFRQIRPALQKMVITKKPLHINVQFRKPLQPKVFPKVTPPSVCEPIAQEKQEANVVRLPQAKRPLIIAGEIPWKMSSLIDANSFGAIPALVEPSSNLPSIWKPWESKLIENLKNDVEPDLIIRLGRTPINQFLYKYLEKHSEVDTWQFSFDGFFDNPVFAHVVEENFIQGSLGFESPNHSISKDWIASWEIPVSEQIPNETDFLTDGLVHQIASEYSTTNHCFYSNSFPVRDAQTFGFPKKSKIHVNRGASGIDGIISTAAGIVLGSKSDTLAFVGDLAFQHDTNGLSYHNLLFQKKVSLTLVVINNGGGGIFSMLPIRDFEKVFDDYFFTPQKINLSLLSQAHGVNHTSCRRKDDLIAQLKSEKMFGITVIECHTNHDASMKQRRSLWLQG